MRAHRLVQPARRRGVNNAETENGQKLSRKEAWIIVSSGVGGILGLFLIAWLLLPISAKIVPFVVAGALPLFTLFAIIYQAVVYRRQWNVMQHTLKQNERVITKMQSQIIATNEQTEVLKKALIESQKQTANSEAGLRITQHGIEHAQRAYVTIVGREFFGDGFNFVVENSGNTPALEVHVNAIVTTGGFAPKDVGSEGIVHIGLLAPRVPYTHTVSLGRSLSAAEQEEFENEFTGEFCYWWVTGYIFYRDIFQGDQSNYHVTEFSFYWGEKTNGVRADSSGNGIKEYRNGQEVKRSPKKPETN
jgi:uncharacterized membrane protein (GlpM family)